MARNLKLHLFHIKDKVERDSKFIVNTLHKTSTIVREFRERCKQEFIDFLKDLDFDLRKTLKPLVPSSVIEENVSYPKIGTESLNSSMESAEDPPFDGDSTNDKLILGYFPASSDCACKILYSFLIHLL